MHTNQIREELARQDAELASAMNTLKQLGAQNIAVPEETLQALEAACEVRPTTHINHPGIRG